MRYEEIKSFPNQRVIEVNKEPADKQHKYTINNLSALDEAAARLISVGGFKLYIYIAKNQDKYCFALSSADFYRWSSLGKQAYTTAFQELVSKGYLVKSESQKNKFIFYEKSQLNEDQDDNVLIVYANNEYIF